MKKLLLALMFWATTASAQDFKIPSKSWAHEHALAVRVNPLGLMLFSRLGHKWRLSSSDSMLFENTYLELGPSVAASPAWARGGVTLTVQPINLFRFRLKSEAIGLFGTFGSTQSWENGLQANNQGWSDSVLNAREDTVGDNYATYGLRSSAEGLLQAKVGPVAVRSTFQTVHQVLQLRDGDQLVYDQVLDVLIPNNGFALNNDADLLGLIQDGRFVAGVRHTWTHTPAAHDGDTPAYTQQRVGPMFMWSILDDASKAHGQVQLITMAQWWLQHANRTGQDVPQGIPYFVLAVKTSGFGLPWKRAQPVE